MVREVLPKVFFQHRFQESKEYMFEEIRELSADQLSLITDLKPLSANQVFSLQEEFPGCPDGYWKFLFQVGYGKIKEPSEPENFPAHFEYLERPLSAERNYYQDKRIYEGGAQGDILIFGVESTGTAFGFDTGDNYQIVEVDNYRIVRKLDLDFKAFTLGLLACYPDFPQQYQFGKWFNDLGDEFSL